MALTTKYSRRTERPKSDTHVRAHEGQPALKTTRAVSAETARRKRAALRQDVRQSEQRFTTAVAAPAAAEEAKPVAGLLGQLEESARDLDELARESDREKNRKR